MTFAPFGRSLATLGANLFWTESHPRIVILSYPNGANRAANLSALMKSGLIPAAAVPRLVAIAG